jgi:hypothetical protein
MISAEEPPIEVLKFPYPYQAAFTVASDIDSSNLRRFRAIHDLFSGSNVIQENGPEWQALGLARNYPRFDKDRGGIPGLGMEFADSFFLVPDRSTFGMYRYVPRDDGFTEDEQEGQNCAGLIRQWLKQGRIDSFHAFLHYTRRQIEPLLSKFYGWCERENVPKPQVWINHSAAVTPSGLCPEKMQPSRIYRLARLGVRFAVGPFLGRKRWPLRYAFVRYWGDTPSSPYYTNDLLFANGLRYVWLNTEESCRDWFILEEHQQNGRSTILEPVTMDDGIRYWRFERCHGGPSTGRRGESYLRDSKDGYDVSHVISESNLDALCRANGTCILYTHWSHPRSMPLSDGTISRFELLRRWSAAGRVWVTSTSRLLQWTRLRTFLKMVCRREGNRLIVEIDGLEDPIFGHEAVPLKDLDGLCLRLRQPCTQVTVAVNGNALNPDQIGHKGDLLWVRATGSTDGLVPDSDLVAKGQPT